MAVPSTHPSADRRGREVLIAGASMRPTLEVGDVVYLEDTRGARCGDVVVFSTALEPLCHRVVISFPWVGGWRFVHRGDAPGSAAGIAGVGELLGRVREASTAGRARPIPRRLPSPSDAWEAITALARAGDRVWRRRTG